VILITRTAHRNRSGLCLSWWHRSRSILLRILRILTLMSYILLIRGIGASICSRKVRLHSRTSDCVSNYQASRGLVFLRDFSQELNGATQWRSRVRNDVLSIICYSNI
jgi:hypothetical protein